METPTAPLQTLGGSVEARGKLVGLVCISCPDLSGLVGPLSFQLLNEGKFPPG